MHAPSQVRSDSDAIRTKDAGLTTHEPRLVVDRPATLAQLELAETIDNSPRVAQQRALRDSIQNSPRMIAQRKEKPNNTGLPDQLKSGMESLSGMSLDHVKVHYNSNKPAQLQAHAYAQGSDIHLAPGQEQHLPHEAWHVVQQAQGRVRPTRQMKANVPVNDDAALEAEADAMGQQALALGRAGGAQADAAPTQLSTPANSSAQPAVQRRPWLKDEDTGVYRDSQRNLDLAFIRTSGKNNVGAFFLHARLGDLRTYVDGLLNNAEEAYDGRKPAPMAWKISQVSDACQRKPAELLAAVTAVYVEAGNNLMQLASLDGQLGIIKDLVTLGACGGVRIRNEGGGSRLPAPKGTLYLDRNQVDSKDTVLTGLGVEPGKRDRYEDVDAVVVNDFADVSGGAAAARAQGATTFAGDGFIYASTTRAPLSANRKYTANGRDYDATFSNVTDPSPSLAALTASYESLAGPDVPQWEGQLSGGRDGNQNTAMNKWGALGAAAFHNRFRAGNGGVVPVDTNWEWLHVRGAQIGGETRQGNLLAGTFVANSQMIPFESQLQRWFVGNHGKIVARFSATVRDQILAERITIEIATDGHPTLGTIPREAPLRVEFYPLEGKVIDKLAGKIQQKKFKEQAEGRAREFTMRMGQLEHAVPPRPLPFAPQDALVRTQAQQLAWPDRPQPGGLVFTASPMELSVEGSFQTLFGDLISPLAADPFVRLVPVLTALGSNGFSISAPALGGYVSPQQLMNPLPWLVQFGQQQRDRPVRKFRTRRAEEEAIAQSPAPMPRDGNRKRSGSDLMNVEIKISRPGSFQPTALPARWLDIPPLDYLLMAPRLEVQGQEQDRDEDMHEEHDR